MLYPPLKEQSTVARKQETLQTELAEISMMVSLESYTITEKAEGIGDVEVEINLKEYDEHLTSYYVMTDSENGTAKEVTTRPSERTVPSSYTVKNGDSL